MTELFTRLMFNYGPRTSKTLKSWFTHMHSMYRRVLHEVSNGSLLGVQCTNCKFHVDIDWMGRTSGIWAHKWWVRSHQLLIHRMPFDALATLASFAHVQWAGCGA